MNSPVPPTSAPGFETANTRSGKRQQSQQPKTPMKVRLTLITSRKPARLSKSVRLGPDGTLVRNGGGILVEGKTEILSLSSLQEFASLLESMNAAQALTFGIPRGGNQDILSRAALAERASAEGITTRTRDQFTWPDGAGILMLDHDPAESPVSRDDLVDMIRRAAPGLSDVQMLWWPSASSHICDTQTGEDLTGLRGQRLYIPVLAAADIPRAGAVLVDRLWAAGLGHISVSAAGAALERCPVDASVWQPERLDFAAGAICGTGLAQRRGRPQIIAGDVELLDSRAALPDDNSVKKRADAERRRAKQKASPAIQAAREAFVERMSATMLAPEEADDNDKREAIRSVVRRALDLQVLSGDFPVEIERAPEHFETVSVEAILADRATFHGCLTRDPLEPDYDGGRVTGKLFLLDSRPTLFSFARHGRSFRLIAAPKRIEVPKGRLATATDAALAVLRHDPDVFDHGGEVVLADKATLATLDEHALGHHLAGSIQFWQSRKAGDDFTEADIDPPAKLVRQILSLGPRRKLKPLAAIVTAPTIRPDGSLLSEPGYDAKTSLLVSLPDRVDINPTPSRAEVLRAIEDLMHPFNSFPLVDHLARGALLAALLTAVVRPTLKTAPAFAMDAPVQGSGKTLLASCIAVLATGRPPEIWPHTAGRDDEEIRKRLLTALRGGTTALVWDNITGVFDSAALAAAITAPVLRDRVLGRSESLSIPNRALLLFTGNNLCLTGDLARRIIPIRIDPGTDTPFARQFDLDPVEYVLDHRNDLVCAALLLIRGWLSSGAPRAAGRMASFEAWDDLVRQTVCWLDREIVPGQFGDPMDLVQKASAGDPEKESLFALIEALKDVFGSRWFSAREASQSAVHGRADHLASAETKALANALSDIAGERALTSTRSVGRTLQFREGRIVFGLRLRSRAGRSGREYRIEVVDAESECGFGGFGGFDSAHSESRNTAFDNESKSPETNPPNPPNPQTTWPGGKETL